MSTLKLGILGGGQLARMTALAAAEYGVACSAYDTKPDVCAGAVCDLHVGAFDDHARLLDWVRGLDAVTLEFENIPAESLEFLAKHVSVRPSAALLMNTQDRLVEKSWLKQHGFHVAPFYAINTLSDLMAASNLIMGDMFLKTRRMGYDGKGQVRLANGSDEQTMDEALSYLNAPCIVEASVPFVREVSMIVARNPKGQMVYLPMVENQHEALAGGGKILRTTIAPASTDDDLEAQTKLSQDAAHIALEIAEKAGLEGLLAIEMFETEDHQLWINELAPRPHNSGHWSINGASLSQFHLLVRAALDLPLPEKIRHRPTVMTNLLGEEVNDLAHLLGRADQFVHIYGKGEAKSGRKMGHINKIVY